MAYMQVNSLTYHEMIRCMVKKEFQKETGIEPMDSIRERQFLGIGQPEDVAGIVAYLLSSSSNL